MKYIIRCGTREREFQGTPSEIMELKSRLERTEITIDAKNLSKEIAKRIEGM